MDALILLSSKSENLKEIGEKLSSGAITAGAQPEMLFLPLPPEFSFEKYDLIFLGFELSPLGRNYHFPSSVLHNFSGKNVALICLYSFRKRALEKMISELEKKGAKITGTLSLKKKGIASFFGFGKISETDSVRTEAFAERTSNNLLGRRIRKDGEKSKIPNYRK